MKRSELSLEDLGITDEEYKFLGAAFTNIINERLKYKVDKEFEKKELSERWLLKYEDERIYVKIATLTYARTILDDLKTRYNTSKGLLKEDAIIEAISDDIADLIDYVSERISNKVAIRNLKKAFLAAEGKDEYHVMVCLAYEILNVLHDSFVKTLKDNGMFNTGNLQNKMDRFLMKIKQLNILETMRN